MTDPCVRTDSESSSTPSANRGLTRRHALAALGTSVAAAGAGWTAHTLRSSPPDEKPGNDEALDEVLRELQKAEPESRQGLSTHAPMATEALCALGFPQKAGTWLKNYRAPVRQLPKAAKPIDREHWKDALGPQAGADSWEEANGRWGDWKEFFAAELADQRWPDVLDTWVARLAPGMSGAATHGVIRTAHAVRALGRRKTPERIGELARGLAYWASSYEELPVAKRKKRPLDTFAAALDEVPLYRTALGKSPQGRCRKHLCARLKKRRTITLERARPGPWHKQAHRPNLHCPHYSRASSMRNPTRP
jgi:hypothetical protein